jgi:hypothetical protein
MAVASWAALAQAAPAQPGLAVTAHAATATLGGINVEPAARPWQYVGANPDGWWCPVGQCTTPNPLARIDSEMSLAHQLNVSNVRIEIPWFLVETSRGGYDWTRADYIFNSASAHGVLINPILVYTPSWDGAYNSFPVAADFGGFVSQFMGRYGGRITAVEMWNEPDGGQSLAANNVASYVSSILIPGYNAVKQSAHPNVKVIEGGSINDSGTCCAWLSGIYNAGGGAYFDIAAYHDYGGNYAQIAAQYRAVINAHLNFGNKPIWLGEFGVSDANGSQQTSLILAAMTNTAALAVAQFYTLRDESVYKCCPPAPTGEHKQYGVVAADGVTKKSSFYTMQSILGGSAPPPPPPAAPPPAQPKPTPSPVIPTPTPTPTPSPVASPSPSAGQSSSGNTKSGSSGSGGSSAQPLTVAALSKGGPRLLYFLVLLIGLAGLGVGLAVATNVGALATARLTGARLRRSIQSHRPMGVVVATCGGILCVASIFLLNVLPRSG